MGGSGGACPPRNLRYPCLAPRGGLGGLAPQESPLITRALPPQRPCLAPVPCPQFFFVQIFSSKFFSFEFFSSEFFDRNFFSVATAAGAAATDEKCEMRKVFRAKSIWTRRYVRMSRTKFFLIQYSLHSHRKTFSIRTWRCHAGVAKFF